MIISVRGASGSGKTHLVRRVKEMCRDVFVPGDYNRINGGIDSLPDLDMAYTLARQHSLRGVHVLMEGRGHEDTTRFLLDLRDEGFAVAVALIEHPVDDCIAAVKLRGYYIPPPAIKRMAERCKRHHERFANEGIPCFAGDRESVFHQVLKWLTVRIRQASCPTF